MEDLKAWGPDESELEEFPLLLKYESHEIPFCVNKAKQRRQISACH